MSTKSPTDQELLDAYKDSVWDFIVEHCDITERGSYFVKFHTTSRYNFEKRIRSRMRGYHRDDERMGFNIRQKEADATARRRAHLDRKESIKNQKKLEKISGTKKENTLPLAEQKRAIAALTAGSTPSVAEPSKLLRVINSHQMQGVAQRWYSKMTLWLKNRHKRQ